MNITLIDKIKIGFAAMFGGVAGLVKALLNWFNAKVLAKLDKDTTALVCKDVLAVADCLVAIAENHKGKLTCEQYNALTRTIIAVKELAKALEDANITPDELDVIIDRVKAAIDAWKKVAK